MLKNWIIGLMALAVLIGGWEIYSRAAMNMDKETQDAAMSIGVAKLCPQMPEARSKATKNLLWYALTNPHKMPPWRVVQILATPMNSAGMEENPFALMLCDGLVKS